MQVFISNHYSSLKDCVVCYPCNLQTVNNVANNKVDKTLASAQYNNLLNRLIQHGVKVQFIAPNGSPSQVFTRDIGFVIDDILFISNMTAIRQTEIDELKELAKKYNLKTHIMEQKVEGGDIIVDNNVIFIGQGNRTNEMSANEIRHVLEKNNIYHEIVQVNFEVSKIHLDCVFNILDKQTCIVSTAVYNPEHVVKYFKRVIKTQDEDLNELSPNIVQLGNNVHLCGSKNFTSTLKKEGFNAVYVDFSEIIKCNGSLGCCVLPLNRS